MKLVSKNLKYHLFMSGMKTGQILKMFNEIQLRLDSKAKPISKNTIHNWRRGDTTPVPISMYILSAVLDKNVDELFEPVIDEELQAKVKLVASQVKENINI